MRHMHVSKRKKTKPPRELVRKASEHREKLKIVSSFLTTVQQNIKSYHDYSKNED